jgi:hypothetical protein
MARNSSGEWYPDDEFFEHLNGEEIMSKQVVVREKKVSHKGVTIQSDSEGNVTVTSKEKELQFSEAEFLSFVDTSTNVIEWESTRKAE